MLEYRQISKVYPEIRVANVAHVAQFEKCAQLEVF